VLIIIIIIRKLRKYYILKAVFMVIELQ